MRAFFVSDTHFGHANIIRYCNRPFSSVEEMDRALIENWNNTVGQYDHVYHLGDFGMTDTKEICKTLKRLNGIKHFIRGNHDRAVKGDALGYFQWVKDYHELKYVKKDGTKQLIVLCHYPFETWNKKMYGSYMIHGHVHGRFEERNEKVKRLDVGVDTPHCQFRPISLEEVEALMDKKDVENSWV